MAKGRVLTVSVRSLIILPSVSPADGVPYGQFPVLSLVPSPAGGNTDLDSASVSVLPSLVPVGQAWVEGLYINQSISVPRFRLSSVWMKQEGRARYGPTLIVSILKAWGRRRVKGPRLLLRPLYLGWALGPMGFGTGGCEMDCLVPPGLVGPAAVGMFAAEYAPSGRRRRRYRLLISGGWRGA